MRTPGSEGLARPISDTFDDIGRQLVSHQEILLIETYQETPRSLLVAQERESRWRPMQQANNIRISRGEKSNLMRLYPAVSEWCREFQLKSCRLRRRVAAAHDRLETEHCTC